MKRARGQGKGAGWIATAVATTVAAMLAIAGCGGSSDATGQSAGVVPTITKAALIKRGDAICRKTDEVQQTNLVAFEKKHPDALQKPHRKAGEEALELEAGLPPVATEIQELAALGAPEGEEAQVSAIILGMERSLHAAERKPLEAMEIEGPLFKDVAELAAKFGFKDCSQPL